MAETKKARSNKPRNDLTAEYVRSILDYDPETGVCLWRSMQGRWKQIGYISPDGYIRACMGKTNYLIHRLVWLIETGKWPTTDIDHINGIRHDNRRSNLREATRQQNLRNMRLRATNRSGFKGVTWCKITKKWKAQIRDGITNRYLGVFHTPEEAHAAYCKAAEALSGEFARFG